MAKQTLPTNFVDDILAPSMGGKRKYRIIDNGDGTYEIEDVTDYTQTGSDYGAGQINATNQAVNESCDKADVIDNLDDIIANQADGKIAGAKAVADLNSKLGKNYIVEEGSNSNGKYRKWSDGTLEMWNSGNATCAIGTAAGSMYMSQEFILTFPVASKTACYPVLSIIAEGAIWGSASSSANSYRTSFRYRLMSATVWSLASFSFSYYARGTWK